MMDVKSSGLMKVWICREYGGPEVLALEERPRPVPVAGEVLVRLRATTVSSADARMRSLQVPRGFRTLTRLALGIRRLRQPVLGSEFAGVVEAVGTGVSKYQPGDAVVGFTDTGLRCHVEYRVMREDGLMVPQPAGLGAGEAAALFFGGTTALYFLRKAGLRAGESLLVTGASGAVGSAMVQLAVHQGAVVSGVASTRNLELIGNLGVTRAIDYTALDFTRLPERYDVIADTVACSSFRRCLPVLKEGGRYLAMAADLWGTLPHRAGTKRSMGGMATARLEDLKTLARLASAGIYRPVVDRVFSFADLPEAHALVDSGHKRGNVVVEFD
jgi:NADPH:quinone reductase-like Zn-dependent oxidoreductase